jgi:hypothetical protein
MVTRRLQSRSAHSGLQWNIYFKINGLAELLCGALAESPKLTFLVNVVNKVNVMNMWKSTTFTTYPHETKGLVDRRPQQAPLLRLLG